ncbi:cupin domain-containing protein [Planctomicrobium sp. SH668]|uniref:cupin domain-containing protein n=1 Tax=Planctomicrobium sp. SH668 TaxID=3448126 RepID=UPI003F5C403C
MVENIFKQIPSKIQAELTQNLLQSGNIRIERIISEGHASPPAFWYDQEDAEWVIVLQGEARLDIEGSPESIPLGVGDHYFLPAHCRHRVSWTSPDVQTIWLVVFIQQH